MPSLRLASSLLFLVPAVAAAQGVPAPAPVMPLPPPAAIPWSPVDDDGWPTGVSLETLRGLRACRFGEVMPGPGERIPCRPAAHPEPVQWQWGLDWTTGVALENPATTGALHALGVEVDFTLARRFALGARYELAGVGLRSTPDDVSIRRHQRFFGHVRYRAFTDEVDRDAWALTVGGGYALGAPSLGGDAPLARVALAREIGLYLDDENAGTAALELAYTRSFGDDTIDTVTASARLGFEFNIAEPKNADQLDTPWSQRAWTGADIYASPFMLGFGVSLGYRLGGQLHAVGTGSYVFGRAPDSTELEGLHGTVSAQGGLRLGAGWPAPAPLYVQLTAGPGLVATDAGLERHTLADADFGVMFLSCGGMASAGVRLRAGIDDGVDVLSGGLFLRVAIGTGAGHGRGRCGPAVDERGPIAYMGTPPPPPPAPMLPPPPPPIITPTTGAGTGTATGTGTVTGGARVDVVVAPPQPIVIDVSLGAVFLGGLVEVRIDPRLLPLDRLRGVDVDVRIEGPSSQLARFTGEMSAVLGRQGIAVRGWSQVATSGTEIHAVFTIYPPGTRR